MSKKKILTIAALLTAAALVCVLALASTGTVGDSLTWSLDGDVLTINGTGTVDWSEPWGNLDTITLIRFTGPATTATNLPTTATNLPGTGVIRTEIYTFVQYNNLAEVVFPNCPTEIGEDAFSSCSNLTRVTIPYRDAVIGDGAFTDCSADLTIRCRYGSAVWDYAVENGFACEPILDNIVTLPEDLTSVGSEAFANDPAIDAVRFHIFVTDIAANAFDPHVVIIAPAGSYAAQWATDNGYALIAE